ncbi:hypothetical protein TI04_03620 [Achromatium sp. WMS2]|nr:hypothetical protein TI04_03620 [Achromatium sp. WMS2]
MFTRFLFLISWLTLAAPVCAEPHLTAFLDNLYTLQADFIQTVIVNNSRRTTRTSRGTFYLSRPDRFRWNYSDPAGQEVVADGSRVWLYNPELEQVSHKSQASALRGTPALLLSSMAPIEQHFQVTSLGTHNDLEWIRLIPKNPDSEVSRVDVAFDGNNLDRFEMIDAFGQTTRFMFIHVQRNPRLNPRLFRFTPPPAVDILGN